MDLSACRCSTSVSKIKVKERGRKAVICNRRNAKFVKTRVDGCLVRQTAAADWVISKPKQGDVFIELKGTDVDHAFKQIMATVTLWRVHNLGCGKQAGLIVCRQYPQATTRSQRAKVAFLKLANGPLHVVSGNYEYCFENILSFNGPFRKE